MLVMISPRERDAIIKSLAAGVVPTIGLHHVQVDRAYEIKAMIGDLERVKEGGASFRFVIGRYGTGKSFFLNLAKTVALAERFVVLQADVTQKRRLASTTGYARDLYAALLGSMSTKACPEGGAAEFVLENWIPVLRDKYGEAFDVQVVVRDELKQLQDMVSGYHFTQAVTKYCESRIAGSEENMDSAKKWLTGGYDKLTAAKSEIAIDSYIGDKDIYDYLKLWGAFVRIAGYSGLLILLDEMAALTQALANNTARAGNYEVILNILNDCLQGRLSGVGFLFAGTDDFLDDRRNGLMSHGALASRLAPNPFARDGLRDFSTPVVRLGEFAPEDLYLLFENIRDVFAMGDRSKYLVPDEAIRAFLNLCAWSLGPEFYKTPRDAVKLFTGFLSVLEQNSQVGWQKLLDGTVIKSMKKEPEADSQDDAAPQPVQSYMAGTVERETRVAEVQVEKPRTEEPRAEEFWTKELHVGELQTEEPRAEEPRTEEPSAEEFWTEEPHVEELRTEEPRVEEFWTEEPRVEEFRTEGLRAEAVLPEREPDATGDPQPWFGMAPEPYAAGTGLNLRDPDVYSVPEEDMREGRILYGNEDDLRVYLPNLISRNPLIGMERIPTGIHNDLARISVKILINAYNNYLPNGYEKMLLTVTLINTAKRFPSENEEAFRSYLFRQLGFEYDACQTILGTMCGAVYETTKSHQRFFSHDPGTNKRNFYSTIMTHAFSPRESVFAWFDFLMDFLRENLRGVLIGNDPAVNGMMDVLREAIESAPDQRGVVLKGRRYAMGTGIVTLLLKRPAGFKKLTCEILEKMGRLASGGRLTVNTYLDELLTCWLGKEPRPQIERAALYARPSCPTAASYGAICTRYEVEKSNSVVLVIPSLRIRERIRDCREAVADIQCGDSHMRENLVLYGDKFAWTVSETRIPVSRMSGMESARYLRIRVKILIENRVVYDSRTSLYRDIIIFRDEREIPACEVGAGLYSVFAPSGAEIIFDPTADDRIIPISAGQMRAVKFGGRFSITVNGRIACSDYREESARIVASSEPRPDLSFFLRGRAYDVCTGDFSASARIPSGRDLRAYSLKAGNGYYSLNDCEIRTADGVFECLLRVTEDMITDRVFDVALVERGICDRELYRRGYCVLRGINVAFDKPYYFGDASGGTVRIASGSEAAEVCLGEGKYAFLPFGEGYMRVKAPIVSWRLEPRVASVDADGAGIVWRGDIPPECKMIVTCPDGVQCKLKIGGSAAIGEQRGSETVFAMGAA